jgi:hypothetical protein
MGLVGGASIDAPPSAYLGLLYFDSITPSDEVSTSWCGASGQAA